MRFIYYDVMEAIFRDAEAASVITTPEFIESETAEVGGKRKRDRSSSSSTSMAADRAQHFKKMEDIQENYYKATLKLQEEALDIERSKVEILKQLLQK